jgi:hypothetical protein
MSNGMRRKVVVPIELKLEALQEVDKGNTVQNVAEEYGVTRVIAGVRHGNEKEIEIWCSVGASN